MAAQITTLPTPPSRQDPTSFNDRADAFLGALPTFQSEANALSTEVNTRADNVQASDLAVLAATNITKWVSGTTYAQGAVVWSPINGLGYRRITASGSGTTDPSLDTTNYKQINGTGDVSTSGNQTIAGVKTFSTPIAVGSGGTGASNAAAAFNNIKQAATESYAGVIELATSQEAYDGTAQLLAITPATLRSALSASGSAPIYAARAWVNFNGTGTVVIRASGNVSSITDIASGNYQVNIISGILDSGYSLVATCCNDDSATSTGSTSTTHTAASAKFTSTTTAKVYTMANDAQSSLTDQAYISVVLFR